MRSFQHYHNYRNHHQNHRSPPSQKPALLPTPPHYHHSPPFRFHQAPPKPHNNTYYHQLPSLPNYQNNMLMNSISPIDQHQPPVSPPAEFRVYSPSSPFYSPVSPNYCGTYYYPHHYCTTSPDYNAADYSPPWSPKYSLPSPPVFLPPPPPSPPPSPVYSPSCSPSVDDSLAYSPSYVPYTP